MVREWRPYREMNEQQYGSGVGERKVSGSGLVVEAAMEERESARERRKERAMRSDNYWMLGGERKSYKSLGEAKRVE
ncbi:hypothetical protein SOVF_143440 [Spinacia oleracea]|nr:hypothetical protein SOVF_143440 [Spinacia oleracea]